MFEDEIPKEAIHLSAVVKLYDGVDECLVFRLNLERKFVCYTLEEIQV
jgi:hypothetical protein